ncbi:hypothetical protein SDC9_114593 [bioreactor metagenome]|uniref:Uncharacterized protein n=1 Tax=bioreactor metagenome TaxID=1076179 RepID=A0A645BQG8_9ZZZZ
MAGIINAPMADVVATAEPDIAAKNIHATVVTIPSPPVIAPKQRLAKFKSLLATPPVLIKLPANMKNGIAIKGNEFIPVIEF